MTAAERKSVRAAKRYAERKENGDCVECGADASDSEGVRCARCNKRKRARQLRYLRTAEAKQKRDAAKKRARARWKADGLCCFCGAKANGRALCAKHRASAVAATRKWRARQKQLKQAPPGWSVEWDRREELLALSELTLMRKLAPDGNP